jgi:nucleotide-binding universal stress UspA family protein
MMSQLTLLVAVDDSPEGYEAARLAGEWFDEQSRALVLHVGDVKETTTDTAPVAGGTVKLPVAPLHEVRSGIDRDRSSVRDVAVRAARLAGGEPQVRGGDPVETITTAAKEIGADLIVIGAHQRSLLGQWFGRSTTERVIAEAPCPVLVATGAPVSRGSS